MEEKKLDAAESLALIGRMIENTRNQLERNAGRPFLVWGYTTFVLTIVIWSLVSIFQDGRWNILWILLPVAGGGLMYFTRPKTDEGKVYTFVDRVIGQVWLVFGLSGGFVSTLTVFSSIRIPIFFTILLLMGLGTLLTGMIIRFRPVIVGGAIGVVLAPITLLVPQNWIAGLFAAGFVAMMIIPGHILNYKSNHPQQA